MATIINADTVTGLKLTSDLSGQLELQSAGSTKVTMDTSGKVGIGGTPSEPLSVFRTGGQEEGINIRNTSSGNGSRLTFETTRSDDSSVQDMAAIQVYAVAGYDSAANSDAIMTFQIQDSGTTSEAMRIASDGKVYVACTAAPSATVAGVRLGNPVEALCAFSSGTATVETYQLGFYNGNGLVGRISTNGTATSYTTSSDYRLKENNVNITDAISRIKLLKPYRFNFITDSEKSIDGFFAHEVQGVVPEAISGTKDAMKTEEYEVTPAVLDNDGNVVTEAVMETREVPDYQGIDQSKLVPLLTAALQEAIQRIEALEAK